MKILIVSLMAMLAMPAWAQEDALKDLPGYVDFGELNSIFGEPSVQIAVGGSLLSLVGTLSASEDPELGELFKRLHGVRVSVFETEGMADGAVDYIKQVSSSLNDQGWESVVTVNTADEQVRIFMKINEDKVEGITVMTVEEDEAAFINVIGNLDPEQLGRVMDNFDIDLGSGSEAEHDSEMHADADDEEA
jgi:hypothetical protein